MLSFEKSQNLQNPSRKEIKHNMPGLYLLQLLSLGIGFLNFMQGFFFIFFICLFLVRNPPPICAEIPDFHKLGSLCVDFYNITLTQNPGACVRIEGKLLKVTVEKVDIGCFHIPHDRFHPVVGMLS